MFLAYVPVLNSHGRLPFQPRHDHLSSDFLKHVSCIMDWVQDMDTADTSFDKPADRGCSEVQLITTAKLGNHGLPPEFYGQCVITNNMALKGSVKDC